MSETVTGYIDHVIYRNEENGYTVLVLKAAGEEELTCVGSFADITQGATIEAEGTYTEHAVYGRQFQIRSFVEKPPEDSLAMERYLGSGAIKGIGAALAARIVRHFGEDTLRIVEEEPERLSEVKGISDRKAREIAAQVTEKADMRRAMIFLQKYGISLNLGAKIYQKYGQEVYPYDSAAVTVPMANDSSICFKMSYGTSTYLSCGDLYYSGERMVLDRHKDDLHALVAKANHHGNMTSSIPEWVDAVGAKIVVGMKDGLPDDLVKKKDPEKAEFWKNHVSGWPYERWPEHGADYYFTYWNGEVRVEMDDQGHATAYPQRGTKNMRPSSIG